MDKIRQTSVQVGGNQVELRAEWLGGTFARVYGNNSDIAIVVHICLVTPFSFTLNTDQNVVLSSFPYDAATML